MKQVTQPEYHAFIRQYTNRQSYRTGIVEPPQEICKLPDGVIIGRIIFPFNEPQEYYIADID